MKTGSVETLRAVWPARRLPPAGTHAHETEAAEPARRPVPVESTNKRGGGEAEPLADGAKPGRHGWSKT